MRTFGPLLCLFLVLASASLARAQGGAAGYGQGGGGFGGGGMGGGFRGGPVEGVMAPQRDEKMSRPEEDDQGLWQTKTAILTPGDRVEFKLKMKKGESLFASATSDAFDPALSVEDGKGKVLQKNDDRAEGDQSPFIIYRAPEDGEYVLKVLSFRSVSGGKFTLKLRTFVPMDAPLGSSRIASSAKPDGFARAVFSLSCQKGHCYDLRKVISIDGQMRSELSLLRIVGPTGVEANDFQDLPTGDGSRAFAAKVDGSYYLEYELDRAREFLTDFRDVQVIPTTALAKLTLDMEPRELKVLEFPVAPGKIIRTMMSGKPILMAMNAPAAEGNIGVRSTPGYGNNALWAWFKMNVDSDEDVVRIFHGEGTARLTIRSASDKPLKVTFENAESLPAWKTGVPVNEALAIGDSRLFLIRSSKSELMRVNAKADHFQPRLDIFRMNGELANSLCDRVAHDAGDDLYFPDEGTFVVRLSCDGNGGSGEFEMRRDVLTAQAYSLGKPQTLKLDGQNFGLYEVNLEAGKRYELMTDKPEQPLRADLLDDDGQFLYSRGLVFDKVKVEYFVPTQSGRHRLWLRGEPGERTFRFQIHVPPSIGGGG